MSVRESLHWSPSFNFCPKESILKLKKQDLGINPYVANIGSRDQSLTGIGGPRVALLQTGENLRVFLFVINCGHASAPLPDYIHHPYPTSSPIAENDKIWNISRCSRLQASYQSCSTVKISHYQSPPCHRTMGTESI